MKRGTKELVKNVKLVETIVQYNLQKLSLSFKRQKELMPMSSVLNLPSLEHKACTSQLPTERKALCQIQYIIY